MTVQGSFMLIDYNSKKLTDTDQNTWNIFAKTVTGCNCVPTRIYDRVTLDQIYDPVTVSTILTNNWALLPLGGQLVLPTVVFAPYINPAYGNVPGHAGVALVTDVHGKVFYLSHFTPTTPYPAAPPAIPELIGNAQNCGRVRYCC